MLHPSYTELMDAVNSEVKEGEQPIVSSRYSIVIAAAKRARQIIAGAESAVPDYKNKKPLSVAVEELMDGDKEEAEKEFTRILEENMQNVYLQKLQ